MRHNIVYTHLLVFLSIRSYTTGIGTIESDKNLQVLLLFPVVKYMFI